MATYIDTEAVAAARNPSAAVDIAAVLKQLRQELRDLGAKNVTVEVRRGSKIIRSEGTDLGTRSANKHVRHTRIELHYTDCYPEGVDRRLNVLALPPDVPVYPFHMQLGAPSLAGASTVARQRSDIDKAVCTVMSWPESAAYLAAALQQPNAGEEPQEPTDDVVADD